MLRGILSGSVPVPPSFLRCGLAPALCTFVDQPLWIDPRWQDATREAKRLAGAWDSGHVEHCDAREGTPS
eukprot:9813555-Alexandrium_andersonii.AAC.1